MSRFLISFLLGCSESAPDVSTQPEVVQEEPVVVEEKADISYKIDRVEEYIIHASYEDLPQFVYAANEGVNVRNRATANSSVVTKLALGTKIEIIAKDAKETLGSRDDYWYHVRIQEKGQAVEGFLFGTTLTPYRLRADWDGDGTQEQLFVVFNERKELLVRIADPNGEGTWANMSAYTQDDYTASTLKVKLLHKELAGMPLLKIEASNADQTLFWTKYVSYHHGKLLRALEYTEEESGNSYQKKEPKFGPKKLSMLEIEGEVQSDGSQKQTIITKRYQYSSGVFNEKNASAPKEKVLPPQITN